MIAVLCREDQTCGDFIQAERKQEALNSVFTLLTCADQPRKIMIEKSLSNVEWLIKSNSAVRLVASFSMMLVCGCSFI